MRESIKTCEIEGCSQAGVGGEPTMMVVNAKTWQGGIV